jgi:hypothetical protein
MTILARLIPQEYVENTRNGGADAERSMATPLFVAYRLVRLLVC